MTRRARTTGRRPWLAGVALGILAVAVVAISAAALEHVGRPTPTGTAAPVEPFNLGVQRETTAPAPTPTPSDVAPSPDAEPAAQAPAPVVPRAEERLLAVGSVAMWRAVAGECGGALPRLERSTDGGATWADVTPLYTGIQRIVAIDVTGVADADIVAGVGADCGAQSLQSFTQGEFWDAAPAALSTWSFVSPTDAAIVSTPAGSVPAPCADARGLSNRNGPAVVICDGQAHTMGANGEWQALPVTGVVAAAMYADGVLVAHVDESCEGVAVSRVRAGSTAAEPVGCVGGTPVTAPLAIAEGGGRVVVWAGDSTVWIP